MAEDSWKISKDKIVVKIDSDLKELIPGYLQNRRNGIANIRAALETKDFELIQRQGHSMKGSGAGYGFVPVSTLGASIEEAGKTENVKETLDAIDQLAQYLDRIVVVYD